jgi:hypothetical protein
MPTVSVCSTASKFPTKYSKYSAAFTRGQADGHQIMDVAALAAFLASLTEDYDDA